jgi:hypothetical protein
LQGHGVAGTGYVGGGPRGRLAGDMCQAQALS